MVSCLIQPLPAMKRRWCGSFPLIGGRFCPIGDECFAVFPSLCFPFCCWHGLSWRSRFCGMRKRRHCSTVSPRHLKRRRYRSEEHTSELQSLMRISYAVYCSKKKNHYLAKIRTVINIDHNQYVNTVK